MPAMDGFAATPAIRQYQETLDPPRRIPIVALTANAMVGDRDRCLAVGMDDYLSKPFTLQQLEAVIQRWLPASLHALLHPSAFSKGLLLLRSSSFRTVGRPGPSSSRSHPLAPTQWPA